MERTEVLDLMSGLKLYGMTPAALADEAAFQPPVENQLA
jgi:hypothetical protein